MSRGINEEFVDLIMKIQDFLDECNCTANCFKIANKLNTSSKRAAYALKILLLCGAVKRVDKRNGRWFYKLNYKVDRDVVRKTLSNYGRYLAAKRYKKEVY